MSITDDMVERAAEANCDAIAGGGSWASAQDSHDVHTLTRFREGARAALTAALGDVDPLESVLREANVSSVDFALNLGLDDNRQATVASVDANVWTYGDNAEGTGPTIDAAIRSAVANAQESDE